MTYSLKLMISISEAKGKKIIVIKLIWNPRTKLWERLYLSAVLLKSYFLKFVRALVQWVLSSISFWILYKDREQWRCTICTQTLNNWKPFFLKPFLADWNLASHHYLLKANTFSGRDKNPPFQSTMDGKKMKKSDETELIIKTFYGSYSYFGSHSIYGWFTVLMEDIWCPLV